MNSLPFLIKSELEYLYIEYLSLFESYSQANSLTVNFLLEPSWIPYDLPHDLPHRFCSLKRSFPYRSSIRFHYDIYPISIKFGLEWIIVFFFFLI
jgi:hypothetical protein